MFSPSHDISKKFQRNCNFHGTSEIDEGIRLLFHIHLWSESDIRISCILDGRIWRVYM